MFRPQDRFLVFGIFFLPALQAVAIDEFYFILGIAFTATLAIWVPVIEWYQEADQMLHSLPVRRDAVVVARYVAALFYGLIGGLVWNTTGRILLPILHAARETPPFWMSLEGILAFATAFGLLAVLFFPLFFRFGAGKGGLVFLGLCLCLLVLGYATAGLASGPSSQGEVRMFLPSALIRTRVEALVESIGVAGTMTLILMVLAILSAASIKVSQHWFRGKEL